MKFLIINRSFWPENDVVGEGLLSLAESAVNKVDEVHVICQSQLNLNKELSEKSRGYEIFFHPMRSFTSSSSSISSRVFEAIMFCFWTTFYTLKIRPTKIYVSTDPPIIIPFVVSLLAFILKSKTYYHIQDIHPEATNIVFQINKNLFTFLKNIDNFSINNAQKIITLSNEMKDYIEERSSKKVSIDVIKNCAIQNKKIIHTKEKNQLIYCGNLGRLQRIPLLIDSINDFLKQDGKLEFIFIGGGVFSKDIDELSRKQPNVTYLGKIPAIEAAEQIKKNEWAILSIEDEVTKYAYPSKLSSYVLNDCKILSVCGANTNISKFLIENQAGISAQPCVKDIVEKLFQIQNKSYNLEMNLSKYKNEVTVNYFVKECVRSVNL